MKIHQNLKHAATVTTRMQVLELGPRDHHHHHLHILTRCIFILVASLSSLHIYPRCIFILVASLFFIRAAFLSSLHLYPLCTNDALMMRWWCTDDALMMHWWCGKRGSGNQMYSKRRGPRGPKKYPVFHALFSLATENMLWSWWYPFPGVGRVCSNPIWHSICLQN